ncbi:uncharacterized protein LOC143620501 [Bidens hawaiensis]|uniref:uncharacterized protein LOC143620501 n=1 Tax=Bidens hawaiensis TaxID=980011 RepID=UPI00404AB8BE
MGPFPTSFSYLYILVAVDYVSKWAEAQALPTNDARSVVKFLKKLFSRFGAPKCKTPNPGNPSFVGKGVVPVWCQSPLLYTISPADEWQVEVTNQAIKRILEKMVSQIHKDWSEKLDDALGFPYRLQNTDWDDTI